MRGNVWDWDAWDVIVRFLYVERGEISRRRKEVGKGHVIV